jgi:hypothetical protein
MPEFSIGEWVERRIDGAVGRVKKVQAYDGDFVFYVDLEAATRRGPVSQDDLWAGTTVAWRRHHRLHAHVSTRSRDCDGTYTGGYVAEMTLEERCDRNGDLHFQQRMIGHAVTLHGYGRLDVTPNGVEWYEDTDEGSHAVDMVWCSDECDAERPWQRDHRAEEMGY